MQEVCLLSWAFMANVLKDAWSGEPSGTRTQAPGEKWRASPGFTGGGPGRTQLLQGGFLLLSDLHQDIHGNGGHAGGAGAHGCRLGPASSGDHLLTSWSSTLRGSQS